MSAGEGVDDHRQNEEEGRGPGHCHSLVGEEEE